MRTHPTILTGLIALLTLLFLPSAATAKGQGTAQRLIDEGLKEYEREHYGKAMTLFLQAEKTAEAENDYDRLFSAHLNIGNCFLFVAETGEAMGRYMKAYELASKQRMGWKQENYVLNCISAVYFEENDLKRAREIVARCHQSALTNKDTASVITYGLNLVLIANKERRPADGEALLGEIGRLVAMPRWKQFAPALQLVQCDTYYYNGEDEAFIRLAEPLIESKHINNADRADLLIHLVRTYKKRGQLERASARIQQGLTFAVAQEKLELYRLQADICRQQGDKDEALRYQDSVLAYADSAASLQNRQLVERSKARMEIFQAQTDMEAQMARLEKNRTIALLLALLSALACAAAILLWLNTRGKARRNREIMALQLEKEKQDKLLAEKQMKETELIAHYQQRLMEQSLEEKKREISTTVLFVNARNTLLEDLGRRLSELEAAEHNKAIAEMVGHLRQLLRENKNDGFLTKFDMANSDFMSALQKSHPALTPSDVRFLAFVRMNLSNKEIATFMNITPESCKMRKIRLCKKLGFANTAELYSYIASVQQR